MRFPRTVSIGYGILRIKWPINIFFFLSCRHLNKGWLSLDISFSLATWNICYTQGWVQSLMFLCQGFYFFLFWESSSVFYCVQCVLTEERFTCVCRANFQMHSIFLWIALSLSKFLTHVAAETICNILGTLI